MLYIAAYQRNKSIEEINQLHVERKFRCGLFKRVKSWAQERHFYNRFLERELWVVAGYSFYMVGFFAVFIFSQLVFYKSNLQQVDTCLYDPSNLVTADVYLYLVL